MEFLFNFQLEDESIKKIFTSVQISVLKKRLQGFALNSSEKTYYYKFIKPKIIAMSKFFGIDEIFIRGKNEIILERIDESINIIKKLEKRYKNKRILISGSFLFNKKYLDIDVFIFSKYEKDDVFDGKLHISFIPESFESSLFFSSVYQISVSNFKIEPNLIFNLSIDDLLQTYELLIDSILNEEEYRKMLRDFILKIEYISKKVILNPKQLFFVKEKFFRKSSGILLNNFINSLILGYEEDILVKRLNIQIKNYEKLFVEYPKAKNIPIYLDTYKKVISLAKSGSTTIDKENIGE